MTSVSTTPFPKPKRGEAFNASGVVPVGLTRFVFIDNRDPDALFELNLDRDGAQDGPVVRRPIVGLPAGALSDPEGLARIDVRDEIDLVVVSSLCFRRVSGSGKVVADDGLVRIRYTPGGDLHAEAIPGFRDWLVEGHPALADAAQLEPDSHGLNIEGLAWDPSRRALLFGVRSPVKKGRILVLCVHLDTEAPWSTAALQIAGTLVIEKSDFNAPQGIRDISFDAERQEFLILLGRSVSSKRVPFQLCTWDGSSPTVNVIDVTFERRSMKPEGVTAIPGKGARRILFVDDAGGFAVLHPA